MDRKEAKTRLQMLLTNRCSTCRYGDKKCTQDCEFEQAVNMAIEALSAEPTDLISRADAVEAVCMNDCGGCRPNDCGAYLDKSCDIVKALSALPSADRPSVAYICNGTACDGECDECHHTTDIEHAKNFKCVDGKYIETDDRPSCEWSFIGDNLYECTCCGVAYTPDQLKATTIKKGQFAPNYCPNCGAEMRGGNE